MKKQLLLAALLGLFVLVGPEKIQPAAAAPPDFNISVSQVAASGFALPVQITHAGDGSNRIFVVEQGGRIKIVKNGAVNPLPFLDISAQISSGGERGLLGLAFHPNYSANRTFFVNYTDPNGDTIVARWQAQPAVPDRADPASAQTLFKITQPYPNHNGGQLAFGADGYLYIGLGDGGSGGDPLNSGQTLSTPLGKILRIDVDKTSGGLLYAIPAGNPFSAVPGADARIWAWGLRNPWRFSFDRLTGDLYIGDVGQNLWEEIDFQAAGAPGGTNFGWRCMEGSHVYDLSLAPCNNTAHLAGLTAPVADYPHSEGRSVTGGFVYRGSLFPALQGTYFFGDYVDGKIWSLRLLNRAPWTWSPRVLEMNAGFNISAFGEDEQGELYVADYTGGTVRRLTDAASSLSGSLKRASTSYANPGETVTYTIQITNGSAASASGLHLEDRLPAGLDYVTGTLASASGTVSDAAAPLLTWDGSVPAGGSVVVTYQARPGAGVEGSLVNEAVLSGPGQAVLTLRASLGVPRPRFASTARDFVLPGTQPGALVDNIVDPADCDICHTPPVFDAWRGSPMSQAGRDPLLWAAMANANAAVPNAGEFCLRCHTPSGWMAGRGAADGVALLDSDRRAGVSCNLCHRLVDPVPGSGGQLSAVDDNLRSILPDPPPQSRVGSAMLIVDPQDRRRGPFALASNPARHPAWQSAYLGQNSSPLAEARVCGNCHNVDNPLLSWDAVRGQFWPNTMDQKAPSVETGQLFPVETTFDEWLLSDYPAGVTAPQFSGAKPDGVVRTCQDCHMPRQVGLAADFSDPTLRDCQGSGCLPSHDLVGANTWLPNLLLMPDWRLNAVNETAYLEPASARSELFLKQAAALKAWITRRGSQKMAAVQVINQTGHKLPTGYAEGRRLWLNVRAYDSAGQLVFESGAYDSASALLMPDPYLKVYEVQQGLTPEWAALAGIPAGPSFHFVLNNTVIKDNRIPPRGFRMTAFDRPGLRPVGAAYADGQYWDTTEYPVPENAVRVDVTLYYQTASREYIEFLKKYGGVDGQTLAGLWSNLKSPPVQAASTRVSGLRYILPLVR